MSNHPTSGDAALAGFAILGYLTIIFGFQCLEWYIARHLSFWWFTTAGTAGIFISLVINGFRRQK